MNYSERIRYWDIIKGITIILVIWGHSNNVHNFEYLLIYSFHMPLFMIVSGYFFYLTIHNRNALYIVKNKTYKTITPILITTVLLFVDTYNPSLSLYEKCQSFYGIALRHLWFLWAILIDSMIVMGIFELSNSIYNLLRKKRVTSSVLLYSISAIVCIFFMLLPDFSVLKDGVKFMFPCFVFGFCMNQYNLTDIYKKHHILSLILCLCIFICLFAKFNFDYTFYNTGVYIFNGVFPPLRMLYIDIYRVVIGIMGSISLMMLVYEVSQRVNFPGVGNVLAHIGQNTLGIYIVSVTLNHWVLKVLPYPSYFSLPYSLAYTIGMLIVSYSLTILYVRIKSICLK